MAEPPAPEITGPAAAWIEGEESRQLHRAVRDLPEKYRLPILLHYFEGLSGAEIADVLGWSQNRVWNGIYGGCRELRKSLASWQVIE